MAAPTLTQVSNFGSNPGGLNMYSYLPTNLAAKPAVVLALHGCTQSANDYYADSGWSKYADLYGFAVVYAEQPSGTGLTAKCFDWGDTSNDTRGNGQALSVYQMVQYAEAHYNADPARVFITGLSAGGGMTADLLADYPDVFAAGAIDSGPPAQCTTAGITDSNCTSNNSNTKTPQQWGDLVRASNPGYTGPWPRVQVWNGAADYLVKPVAMDESRDQWTNVWGISQTPSSTTTLTGSTAESIYNDSTGKPAVETFSIPNMGHGLAVHPGSAIDNCGTTGAYFLDYICSSYYSMKFFGLDSQSQTPLPAPTGLSVTGTTDNSASLSWNAVSGAASYNVYRGGTKVNTAAVTATSFTDTGLAAGTSYSYTVAAVDGSGNVGSQSGAVTATTSGTPSQLPAPTGLSVTGTTSSSVTLGWNAVSGAASYNVYRGGTKVNGAPVTSASYTDTGLTSGTSYSYTVAAVDSAGTVGAQSATVTGTPSAPLPNCFTTDNVSQNLAGRSYFFYGGDSYAIGSNQDMGKYSSTVISSLQQTSPGYWIVVPHC
ncbi:hypothetical protein GCM10009838_53540 [Catenulispora subtropica]|uniref:Fibronectin type-III domain-containing protein n=1 Tax=Catenulispora subtropica TaxID=450798 RepID=A0ABN2SDL3_9ACTN